MKRNIFNLLILSLLIIPFCPNVKGDIAPYDRIGHSVEGFFIDQDNITMISFSIVVDVDLPEVKEDFSYLLRNNANTSIDMEVMIPIVFEKDRWEYYEPESIVIRVDGLKIEEFSKRELVFDDVLLKDKKLIRDMDHYTGVTINLSFAPYQEIEVNMVSYSSHDDYTESFHYFYTAKTAKFWNGTIEFGYFEFNYLSDLKSIDYTAPNASWNETKLTSRMYNWDGNADYEITIDTGIRYYKGWKRYIPMCVSMLFIACFISVIVYFIHIDNKKKAERKRLKQEEEKLKGK